MPKEAKAEVKTTKKEVKEEKKETKKAEKEEALEYKMDRWVYLNDLAEQISAQ